MAEINSGRFNRWIQKLFYIQSGGPASLYQVDTAIQPVLPYLNGVEERYLQGWGRFGVFGIAAAVAASNSAIRIRNPAGSGVIVVVEQIIGFIGPLTESVLSVRISNGLADLTNTIFPLRLDFRQTPGPTVHASTGTSTVSGGVSAASVNNGLSFNFIQNPNQELTMLPGDAYEVFDGTANEQALASFIWRERVMESSELT